MKAQKWIIIVLAVLLFLSLISGGITAWRAYQQGFTDGYNQGQHNGYGAGSKFGYTSGYGVGSTDGYKLGHTDGYNKGLSEGKAQNANAGYAQGYTDGQTTVTNEWVTWERKWCVSVSALNAPWQACYTPETP